MSRHHFPDGFVWGAATSSQQIEGGRREGGRGESIWDRFASVPGNIEDGSNPDVACDHYHRVGSDIELMKWLGLDAYRFSISWPRIMPRGTGAANPAGLDFYESLVDGLLDAGIEPFPTLYHWDLPQELQDRGGWAERDTAAAFADYAAAVVERLGDRVRRWTTHNEPWCAAVLGHEEGCHAPGLKDPPTGLRAAHHLLLSHGLACRAIRELRPRSELGIVMIHSPAEPASDSAADRNAARWFDGFFNRWFLDPVFRGAYPADAVSDRVAAGHPAGPELPFVRPGDMQAIAAPLDFLGLNYYSRVVMKEGPEGRPESVKVVPDDQLTDMGWEVYPPGLRETLLRVHRDYSPPAIYVTENGAAYAYPVGRDGRIADEKRIDYLRGHLLAAAAAAAAGAPLRGYFVWSLMDNFEWGHGYAKRFGLFGVDYRTQRRIAKDSAYWYREVAARNAVGDEAVPTTRGESRESDR